MTQGGTAESVPATAWRLGWLRVLAPLVLVAGLAAVLLALEPLRRPAGQPPLEVLAVERTTFQPDVLTLTLRNVGPDPVRIAQVQVDAAYWGFTASRTDVPRLAATTLTVPFPWEPGIPVDIVVVTSTGATVAHRVEVPALTPVATGRTLLDLVVVGLLMGVVPVAIGALWLPALRRARPSVRVFALGFTLGLLAFLLVETVDGGLGGVTPLGGAALFAAGAVVAVAVLTVLEGGGGPQRVSGSLAGAIGLHNLGEGLAVGAALAAGEVALGSLLVLGFAVHNVSEGVAIVAPLEDDAAVPVGRLVGLVALAGLPAVPGVLAGSLVATGWIATLVLGLAAGAVGQVLWTIGGGMKRGGTLTSRAGATGVVAGFVVMLLTGLLVAA